MLFVHLCLTDRAALKATLVLFPLLGLTHLLFAINPQNSIAIPRLKEAYLVLSAALQSSQVSQVCFCAF